MIPGREAAAVQGISQLRHAKYLPVPPGGFSIGPGTKRRIIGRRKNLWPRLKPSECRIGRKPSIRGLLSVKSLLPSVISGESRFSVSNGRKRDGSLKGMGSIVVALY